MLRFLRVFRQLTAQFHAWFELPRSERRPVDQIASLHNEKAVHFPDATRDNPAINGLSVASKNFRDLRDSQIFALRRSNFCYLSAHDRPTWLSGLIFYRQRVF